MKILHLLSGGNIGGIEMLCRDISELSHEQNEFCFLYSGGVMADEMEKKMSMCIDFIKRTCSSDYINCFDWLKFRDMIL